MARRVSGGGMGMRTRKKTFVAKAPSVPVTTPDYKFVINPTTGKLDRVVNNIKVLTADTDATDPTGSGAAANGRIPITLPDGTIVYLAYYDAP